MSKADKLRALVGGYIENIFAGSGVFFHYYRERVAADFNQVLGEALAEARAEGECEAQTEVVKGYHEYGWSHKDTVVWAMRRIEELRGQ